MDADEVRSREDFLAYTEQLLAEHRAGGEGWENGSLETFLDALVAWGRDRPVAAEPSWRAFAELLRAASRYE